MNLLILLTVLFVALKLTGHITWEWYWVVSPLIVAMGISIFVVLGITALVFHKESKK